MSAELQIKLGLFTLFGAMHFAAHGYALVIPQVDIIRPLVITGFELPATEYSDSHARACGGTGLSALHGIP